MQPNRLVIGIQPEENITLSLMAKVPGLDREGMRLRAVPLNIAMPDAFAAARCGASPMNACCST
jgi:glucose-6-phosphate 1-dehydrogenase